MMAEVQKERIFTDYRKKIFGYIQSKIRNTQISEDLTSDVFVKIYEKIDSFDEKKASLSTWIYLITRNTVIDYFRTGKQVCELPELADKRSSIEEEICKTETLKELADALNQLNERERDVIILHFYSGKTLKEISEHMGISYSYVKLVQNKALENLKKIMTLQ